MGDDTSHQPVTGVVFLPTDASHAVDLVERAERAGVGTSWLEMNAIGLDPLPLLAAAAMRTERVRLGTAIVPAFSRHPASLATQALSVEGLAPGRLRLGVGPGNAKRMAKAFHHPTDRPLARLREYIQILRPLLHDGRVRFDGDFYSADVELSDPPMTPVLVSALGPRAFAAAGELADGALSWLCPVDYLLGVASPAITRGAAAVGRDKPPLIAHVPVAIVDSADEIRLRESVRQELSRYARVPVFARMLTQAGHPTQDGLVTDDLLDDLVVIGDESTVATKLVEITERGIDELMVSLIPETHQRPQEDALLHVLGSIGSAQPPPG